MSSVIVLDSSDEDEAPAKKPYLPPSIPATITPIKAVVTSNGTTTPLLANALKHKKPKPRTIPSGITITRRSPVTVVASSSSKITNTTTSNSGVNTVAKLTSVTGGAGASAARATATAAGVSAARAIAAGLSAPGIPSTSCATTTATVASSNLSAARPVAIGNVAISSPRTGVTSNNTVPALRAGVTGNRTITAVPTNVTPTSNSFGPTRASIATSVAASFAKSAPNNAEVLMSSLLPTTDNNVSMPALTSLPKINAAFTLCKTNVCQTPTPPRSVVQQQSQQQQLQPLSHQKQQQQQQVLPQLSQLPQLQPSPSVLRKRLTNAVAASPPQLQPQQPLQQQQQPPKCQQQRQGQKPPQVHSKKQQQQSLPRQQQQQQQQQPATKQNQQPLQPAPKQLQPQLKPAPKQLQQQLQSAPKQNQHQLQQQQQQQLQRSLSNSPATITPISSVASSVMSGSTSSLMPLISTVQSMAASATPPLQLLATPPHSAATTFNEQLLFSPELRNVANSLPPSTTVTPMPPLSELSFNSNNNNNNATTTNNNISNNFKIQLPSKRSSHNTAMTPSPTSSPPAMTALSAAIASAPLPRAATSFSTDKITPISFPNNSITQMNTKFSTLTTLALTPTTTSSASGGTTTTAPAVKRIKPLTIMKSSDEAWLKRSRTGTSLNDDVVMIDFPSKSVSSSPKPVQLSTTKLKTGIICTTDSPKPQTPPLVRKESVKYSSPPVLDLTESPEKISTGTVSTASTPTSITGAKKPTYELLNGEASPQSTSDTNESGKRATEAKEERSPMQPEYEELLKTCRKADPSADMEKLVKSKMHKYYYNVHPDFVRSKGFLKNLRAVSENICREPDLVYVHLKTIVDELKVRIKSKQTAVAEVDAEEETASSSNSNSNSKNNTNTNANSTGNKHSDEQIKKLNRALYILTRRIAVLEAAEVDWDDDDSNYLKSERFKKRACQIHEKLCDLTGESKNAHRLAKKPIHFSGTAYSQFNKTLGAYVNQTREFPDYYDVLRLLEHCNRQFGYDLAQFELKRIAHDAFMKVGKLLQSRRKTDLYETVTHFTANEKDPAAVDPMLQAKLSENQKKQTRISDVIEKYAREQDMLAEENREARLARAKSAKNDTSDAEDGMDEEDDDGDDENDKSKVKMKAKAKAKVQGNKEASKKTNSKVVNTKKSKSDADSNGTSKVVGNANINSDEDEDEMIEDEDEDDEDEDENENVSDLEADVEKLANGDLSDAESDVEIVFNLTETAIIVGESKQLKDKVHKRQVNESDLISVVASTSTAATLATKTTNKCNKDKSAKSATVSCDKSAAKPTTAAANKTTTIVNSETAKLKTPTTTKHNNNVRTREKTVEPLNHDTTVTLVPPAAVGKNTTPAPIPNGRVKLTDSNTTKSTTTTSATNANAAQPIIKIVSVSSLNEMVCIEGQSRSNRSAMPTTIGGDSKKGSSSNITTATNKSNNKMTNKSLAPITAATKQSQKLKQRQKQQAVDEIVISDEES